MADQSVFAALSLNADRMIAQSILRDIESALAASRCLDEGIEPPETEFIIGDALFHHAHVADVIEDFEMIGPEMREWQVIVQLTDGRKVMLVHH